MNKLIFDLGGSFIKIATKNDGIIFKEPSMIACVKIGDSLQIKCLGNEAKKLAEIDQEELIVFSPFSEGKIKNSDYATLLIKYAIQKSNFKKKLFSSYTAVVLLPCGIQEYEKTELEKVFYNCGFDKVEFLFTCLCIANFIGMTKYGQKINMIVDIGGTKTDVCLVTYENILSGATVNLGGKGMDKSVLDLISNRYDIELPLVLAEKVKEELASLYENDVSSMKIKAIDNVTNSEIVSIVYAHDVKEAIMPYYEEIEKLIETTLNLCNEDALSQIKTNGIYIAGSVAKTTGLEKFLHDKFLVPINVLENCENCAILGAIKFI